MNTQTFTIKELYKEAWSKTKTHAWYLFCVLVGAAVLVGAVSRTILVGSIVDCIAGIAVATISLVIVSNKTPTFSDLLSSFKSYKITWHYVLATILYALAVLAGLILLIIPGLLLMVRLGFYKFIVIEHPEMGAVQALKESMRITKGQFWKVAGFIISAILLNLAGTLLFLVGLMVTIPVTILANAYLYKRLEQAAKPPVSEAL